jgi:hypothetical protein
MKARLTVHLNSSQGGSRNDFHRIDSDLLQQVRRFQRPGHEIRILVVGAFRIPGDLCGKCSERKTGNIVFHRHPASLYRCHSTTTARYKPVGLVATHRAYSRDRMDHHDSLVRTGFGQSIRICLIRHHGKLLAIFKGLASRLIQAWW